MNLSWARNFTGSLKIVHYDDLVQHLEAVLRSILEFLEFPINEVSENKAICSILRQTTRQFFFSLYFKFVLRCMLVFTEVYFAKKRGYFSSQKTYSFIRSIYTGNASDVGRTKALCLSNT